MDEEDDLLALIVASLEEADKIAAATHGATDAARQAALETQWQSCVKGVIVDSVPNPTLSRVEELGPRVS